MTNTIALPTLEELNARIAYLEPLTGYWSSNCVRTSVDVNLELYCLYAVRDDGALAEALKKIKTYKDIIREYRQRDLLQAAPQSLVSSEHQSPWMDIETAPKDGTIIIGRGPWRFGGDKEFVALAIRYNSYLGIWQRDNDGYGYTVQCHPTFWMSLPVPPTHNSPTDSKASHNHGEGDPS